MMQAVVDSCMLLDVEVKRSLPIRMNINGEKVPMITGCRTDSVAPY
jgi:hypothetical protein